MNKLIEVKLDYPQFDIRKYRALNPAIFKKLDDLSKKIKNKTIIHINATPLGGGVAELLRSQILFERALGFDSRWLIIKARDDFFDVTKKIHNLIQGKPGSFTQKDKETFLNVNVDLGESLKEYLKNFKSAVVIIHDPQPMPLIDFVPKNFPSIIRLHIDMSTPNPAIMDFLRPLIIKYDEIIHSSEEYTKCMLWADKSKIRIVYPAIDPFTEKNTGMSHRTARAIMEQFEINITKPIVTQVSRFDPWKDPMGVINAYYLAKNKIPDLQLVLAGFFFAKDDPEAISVFEKVKKHAEGDHDIHLFEDPRKLKEVSNNVFINALYTASTVVIQKSLREGFGLTMTEAMWKAKPLIAGITTGALIQIKNGKNGILVSSPKEAGEAIVKLIKNPKLAEKMGNAAHKSVKKNFLMTRYILDMVNSYASVSAKN